MAIELRGLTKEYAGIPVLRDLNFTFADGALSCVVGPSGCGKTTLLHLLLGLIQPDSGTITGIAGRRMAAVFQEDRLCPRLTARRNLRLVCPAPTSDAELLRHLAAVGLADCADKRVSALSGGMRRRVAVARALAAPAEILVLDEPFKGLDAQTREQVSEYVRRETAGKTVLLVTHEERDLDWMHASACLRLGDK